MGLCWEYCFAEMGGPLDTANELNTWIEQDEKFHTIEEFHRICEVCIHCQWSNYSKT